MKKLKTFSDFTKEMIGTDTEEDVKAVYLSYFGIKLSSKHKQDARTENVLFEFKEDKNMAKDLKDAGSFSKASLAAILAQSLYYVHRTKWGQVLDTIPKYIVLADRNEAAIVLASDWTDLYTPVSYDWRRAPSSPDPKLIKDVRNHLKFKSIKVYDLSLAQEFGLFEESLKAFLVDKDSSTEQKYVTLDNFESVFEHWCTTVGEGVESKQRGKVFLKDLQKQTVFDSEQGILAVSKDRIQVSRDVYKWFWKTYKRPPSAKDMEGILARADRLENMDKRRFTGEFFTPLPFAKLGLEYIEKVLGPDWHKNYYVWDMACGSGNLEYHLPDYSKVFMSELDGRTVEQLNENNVFPGATVFQYDYLNDDVELMMAGADLLNDKHGWKLPRSLREALADKTKKWVVLINPPFAEATNPDGADKEGVSNTALKVYMEQANLGKAVNELFVQFMCRIHHELPSALFCVFAKLKYVNAQAFEDFRDNLFQPEYKGGFIFPSTAFQGTKGKWPVTFMTWDMSKKVPLEKQDITVDVYNYDKE